MGSTTQIALDLKAFARRTVGGFLNDAAEAELGAGDGRMTKMKECVRMLEEERTKTEAFKRELPLCMLLLTEVIEGLKMEMEQWSCGRSERPFEEFIPSRSRCKEERGEDEADFKDKMNWMSSVQLWSDNSSEEKNDDDDKKSTEKNGRSNRLLEERQTRGASFLPFNCISAPTMKSKEELKQVSVSPDLSLVPTASKNSPCSFSSAAEEHSSGGSGCEGVVGSPTSVPASVGAHLSLQFQPPPRKVRRCWPQELHSRFVNALQQLGGAQVATPKQIRDLMKVDGLTNDEVKSHLQKYRLHTRKAPKVSSTGGRPIAVLGGGMWVPREDCTSSPQQSVSQSGSPQGPLQLAVSNRAHSFPGESCEEEDEKSVSYTWR